MDTFAMIVYCVVIIGLGYYYYKQWSSYSEEQSNATWPPTIYDCPDYWTSEKVGDKTVCKNTFDIGHCPVGKTGLPISQGTVDFSGANYKGENGDYNKCKWTKQCNASWDGVDSQCA